MWESAMVVCGCMWWCDFGSWAMSSGVLPDGANAVEIAKGDLFIFRRFVQCSAIHKNQNHNLTPKRKFFVNNVRRFAQ
eukprot:TRINITY_DN16128_c0_g1_i1.p1 TRINITY_DN16128_c0_g1~~TRINITY_DN16128_c0_g1_i1.p1  ORF type:complete len:78 (-),score=5.04 TRINITY_DN16128_c0_g1_i1:127-360(-)